jgi:hypothetical protein
MPPRRILLVAQVTPPSPLSGARRIAGLTSHLARLEREPDEVPRPWRAAGDHAVDLLRACDAERRGQGEGEPADDLEVGHGDRGQRAGPRVVGGLGAALDRREVATAPVQRADHEVAGADGAGRSRDRP